MSKKMKITLTIEADESEIGESWQLLGKLNDVTEIVCGAKSEGLRQIEEQLEAELTKSGWIPF